MLVSLCMIAYNESNALSGLFRDIALQDNNMTIEDLVSYIDQNPSLLEKMKKEIKQNSK